MFGHLNIERGYRGCDRMIVDLQLPVQSVHVTTKIVCSKPAHGEVYLIQHHVIKFVSDLGQVGGFLRAPLFPPPIKLTTTINNWNIVESGIKHHNPNPFSMLWCEGIHIVFTDMFCVIFSVYLEFEIITLI